MSTAIMPLRREHWPQVAAIYAEGIETGHATFEQRVPSWEDWDAAHLTRPRCIAVHDGVIDGWAVLAPYSARPVYRGVAEVSVYIASHARGEGTGQGLVTAIVRQAEHAGIWTVQAAVFPENSGSRGMLEECGFQLVGVRERLGQIHGEWRDIVLYERRSPGAGR